MKSKYYLQIVSSLRVLHLTSIRICRNALSGWHHKTTNHSVSQHHHKPQPTNDIHLLLSPRALADVEAMERILVKTGLVDFLSTLPVISPAQKFGAWATQKRTHTIESSLASQTPIQICVGVWLARLPQILSSLGKRSSYQRSS